MPAGMRLVLPEDEPDGMRDRFWEKVDKRGPDDCWLWKAGGDQKGYGQFWNGENRVAAHRMALVLSGREYTEDKPITDHLCKNPGCVNPRHLEAVSHRTNTIRGDAGQHRVEERREVDECPYGHPLEGDNLYVTPEGWRHCRQCHRRRNRAYRRRQRAHRALNDGEDDG